MFDHLPFFSGASELKKRVIVGLTGAIVLLVLVFFGGRTGICLLTSGLSAAMMFEFADMAFALSDRESKRSAVVGLSGFIGLSNWIFPGSEFGLLILCFLFLFSFFLLRSDQHVEQAHFFAHFKELMHAAFGMVYLIFLPLYLTKIYSSVDGTRWTLVFLLIVWSGDSAAYFAGKKWGNNKLYSSISPKKTLEGSAGGLLAGIAMTIIFKIFFFSSMPWGAAVLVPLLVGIFAQVGDLCESFLKRAYGKKDSGSILPGHGGFLDRFDGVVFSAPVMYAVIRIFGW